MPPHKRPGSSVLSELLGQRKLLGLLGVLGGWLVLFHLLVNVWLLCVFTSLLVVLGGWLGSRLALDADSFLHLEHFVPLGKARPSTPSVEHERRLDREIHSAVRKAVRDFVSSWYRALLPESPDREFERQVRATMLQSVTELKERARRLDRKALAQRALELCGGHLQSYMAARKRREEEAGPSSDTEEGAGLPQLYGLAPHPALRSTAAELGYARALVNVVLHALVPYPHMESPTGGFVVTELITCNLLLPVISRVSDPDWLNQTVVDVFTKSREPQRDSQEADSLSLSSEQTGPFGLSDADDTEVPSSPARRWDWPPGSRASLLSGESPPPGSMSSLLSGESVLPGSMASMLSGESVESCHLDHCLLCAEFDQGSKMSSVESLTCSESAEDRSGGFCDCTTAVNFCSVTGLKNEEAPGCFGPLRSLAPELLVVSEDYHWLAGIAQKLPPASPPGKGRSLPRNIVEAPNPGHVAHVSIQNVHIAGTSTATEQRGNSVYPYTLYVVKYEAVVVESDSQMSSQTTSQTTLHTVNRRYSEFLNLQTRLEEKPELKKLIKNIKGPKKLFPDLPFSNADLDKAESRKGQLDMFLKQLGSIPETVNSEDMQGFLAPHTDGGGSFEKRPLAKSRIDKMVVTALDTLKTAFPRCEFPFPTEDLEGDADGRTAESWKYRRLRFPSKTPPSLHIPDSEPKVAYCFSEGCSVLNGLSLEGLESFTQVQEKLVCPPRESKGISSPQDLSHRGTSGKPRGTDTAVADVVLNIMCLMMEDNWSWLCTENVQKAIRLLFGTFIERWLDVGVARLTSAPCWVLYLQVLQEAVWPEVITDMLGKDKYRLSLETMLESLQDHHINKHLVYCICDLLLEFLVPESSDESFQKSLLNGLSSDGQREGRPS
ncbi:hypothetical protein NHX12_010450 [Muraenolepis orangiensis]|uniref:Sorting nexin 19 n=1 Tax=Muraenolepis orangiensis TaxID=630683 RepID=A0A9Q0DJ43_9TELE|nr:hypothetical protein NHX12_010450 [Muraenolepis orangiensis]